MEVTLWKEACIRQVGKTKSRPCTAIPIAPRVATHASGMEMTQAGGVSGGGSCSDAVPHARSPKSFVVDATHHYQPP
eukprot:579053-Amphidinium_carterae.1